MKFFGGMLMNYIVGPQQERINIGTQWMCPIKLEATPPRRSL